MLFPLPMHHSMLSPVQFFAEMFLRTLRLFLHVLGPPICGTRLLEDALVQRLCHASTPSNDATSGAGDFSSASTSGSATCRSTAPISTSFISVVRSL